MENLIDKIFSIRSEADFEQCALEVFQYQAQKNPFYKGYVTALRRNTADIKQLNQIPFLPIEFFKSHEIATTIFSPEKIFYSSGTTGQTRSKHLVKDLSIYKRSFRKSFELFYGDISQYVVLALLPSYLENQSSSLVYMAEDLIQASNNSDSGFYLNEYDSLSNKINSLQYGNKKVLLLGVSFALLDFGEQFPGNYRNLIIMETGGMKGRRKELTREELHFELKKSFGVSEIHSEYSMTELLSQAYSKKDGIFECPPWMKILIRDSYDPFTFLSYNESGGVNIIDLANIYSCSFIATQDLGKLYSDNTFEILGRFDNSDIRGCNLLIS